MDVLVLIDKLDDVVHNARPVPLTDQVRVDREEIYDLLDQMRATIPEEIKQARWIVKERQEMLAEAKREAERIVREAEQTAREIVGEAHHERERVRHEIIRLHEKEREFRARFRSMLDATGAIVDSYEEDTGEAVALTAAPALPAPRDDS